jgi:hypothetical protein
MDSNLTGIVGPCPSVRLVVLQLWIFFLFLHTTTVLLVAEIQVPDGGHKIEAGNDRGWQKVGVRKCQGEGRKVEVLVAAESMGRQWAGVAKSRDRQWTGAGVVGSKGRRMNAGNDGERHQRPHLANGGSI